MLSGLLSGPTATLRPALLSRWLGGGCCGTTPLRLGRRCRRRTGSGAHRQWGDTVCFAVSGECPIAPIHPDGWCGSHSSGGHWAYAHHYQPNQHRYTSPIKYVPFLIISDRVSTSVSSCVHPSSFFSCRDYAAYRIERFNEKVVNCCGFSNDAKPRFSWLQCYLLCTIQQYSWRFLFSANKNRGI